MVRDTVILLAVTVTFTVPASFIRSKPFPSIAAIATLSVVYVAALVVFAHPNTIDFDMEVVMARTVEIGIQDFEQIRKNNCFYVDKTKFIKEWWESGDSVTLITRPRRLEKTLNRLSDFLCRCYGKKVIVLLDGHGMPMKEAYVNGYSK